MRDVAYFAYGSLVNRQTRSAETHAEPWRLAGWMRQWKHCVETPGGKVCALTATPRPGAEIEGVLVSDDLGGLAAVDRREIGYRRERIVLPPSDGFETRARDAYIYVSAGEHDRWGDAEYPIWRSYVDCVLAGFIDVWGRAGATRFIASTEGWQAPMLDDRAAPLYPRATVLEDEMRSTIDDLLAENGIV